MGSRIGGEDDTGGIITATNHIGANGSLPIAYNVSCSLPDGSRGVFVRITVSAPDDDGNSTTGVVDETVS